MTFIVTLVSLLIERFFDWSHVRYFGWLGDLRKFISSRLKGQSPYLLLGLTIAAPLLLVLILEALFFGALYGFVRLVLQLAILLYCIGPRNLWADTFASVNVLNEGKGAHAEDALKQNFNMSLPAHAKDMQQSLTSEVFKSANNRVFAVVFWFVILGAIGAVLYRVVSELSKQKHEKILDKFLAILNFLPVRLFTFLFALSGQFVSVLRAWRKNVLLGLDNNDHMLEECGKAALGQDAEGEKVLAKAALFLLDRTFIIMLVLVFFVDVMV